jgi:hypothetical protein
MFKLNKYYLFVIFTFLSFTAFSQSIISPDGILFQAVARDANGNAAVSRNVYAKVSIIKGSTTGTVVYAENFQVKSSAEGIFTIVIGKGTRTAGVSGLSAIDWATSLHYLNLKVAIEPTFPDPNWTPNNEYVDLGSSQFWSVPYTLFASKSSYADSTATITNILPGEKGGTGINNKGKTITLGNNIITKGIGDLTITTTAASNVIFPTSGVLANTQYVADKIGTDTVSLSNRIDAIGVASGNTAALKLNIADTASMLSPYATITGTQALTNKTINGIIPTNMATGFSISGGTNTRTTVTVVGDVTIGGVNSGDQLITLTGDVSGSGTGLFPTTVNSVGGVSSSTIANLPTRVNANTASITSNTSRIVANENGIATNTSNIAINTANITANTSNITTNTTDIAALNARVTNNTNDIALRATIASPNFTGLPTAPTASLFNNSNQIATTSFVSSLVTAATPDADAITKGKLQLAGDLGGTAVSPTVNKIGGKTISLGGSLLTAGNIITNGNFSTTINTIGNTNITLPTFGTIATLTGIESLTNKSINGVIPTALATGFTIAGGTNTNTTLTVVGDVTIGGVNSGDQLITLVGDVTGSGTSTFTTNISNGAIDNNKIAVGANITDTKLATIATAGKVLNSATTATYSNTANTIVARDASGNFNAVTITAALAGNASTTTALQSPRIIYGNLFDGTTNLTQAIAPNFGGTGVNNGSKTITLGGNLITGGVFTTASDFIVAGNYSTTLNASATTNITLPTTGTLATLAGTETFTNKTLTSPLITTPSGLVKSDVGLNNVDNTTDLGKPISTATQLALNLKANTASPTFTGTVSGITKDMVGLGNVDNTSDLNKPISTATQNALDLKQNILNQKADIESPSFTGTVTGITKAMIGLGNVDNTSDLNKPVSTATQAALDLKEALVNKSLDITTDATSDLKYPSVKSVKTYVDNTVLNNRAGDATTAAKGIVQLAGDLGGTAAAPLVNKIGGKSVTLGGSLSTDGYFATSGNFSTTLIATGNTSLTLPLTGTLSTLAGSENLTNKIINGVTPTALANGFSIAGGTSTNTTLTVIGDVTIGGVNSGDQLITLVGDVSGAGTGTFSTTINSVGGVSSSTIAGLPTLIASNTASITTNTSNIASNTASITSLHTSVAANTTNIVANTLSITSLDTRVTASTISITSNTNAIASNTASITANTNDIALRATIASPSFTGTPTALTAAIGTNTTQLATTEFVLASITNSVTPDADATTKGKLKLTGDLGGTADAPLVNKIGGKSVSLGGNISTGGILTTANNFVVAGNYSTTLTATGITNITLPTSGTIATLTGTESLTNKVINGVTPTALANGFTIAGGTSTNTTLTVIGDVTIGGVNSGDQLITLVGDVSGSGTGTFSTTINSIGGVSSATIATLPTSVASNTASITALDTRITSNTTSITSNTTNIASNTSSITINTNAIAANTASITSLQNSVASNTASITSNTNNIASNTSSITSLETRVTANTASITANTNDIALRATIVSPTFTGIPSAPTAAIGTSTTQIATTAFVTSVVGGSATPDADATTKGKIQLSNDLGGTAAAPTVNSVGGVSSATITTLPTTVATNSADIISLQTSVNANTVSITANTARIATNTNNITSNTSSITSIQTTVNANTASITANTNSIATNTSNIATNTSNIATNTSNITVLQTNVASNTSSITSLEARVTANTSSITTNTNDIALRATVASPTFTGIPSAPTAAAGTSTTQIATTAFVTSVVGGSATPDADATTKGKIQLTNDLGGTAAAPTVNSVGGVSSATIASLPTTVSANTASITANTNSIATNTANITTNTNNITANTTSITSIQTTVNANTASITANTATIATNTTNIASNSSSITSLQTTVNANTASITANTNAINLRATIASPSFTGTPTAPTPQDGTNDTQIATTAFVQNIVSSSVQTGISASATPDATSTTKGKIKLTNDLGGTADQPTVNSIGGVSSSTISNLPIDIALRATIASPSFTGTPTAPTAAPGTSTNQIATTAYVASVVGGSATPDADATTKGKIQLTNDLGGTAAAPIVNSVGGVSASIITSLPTSIAANTSSITSLQTNVNANSASITSNTTSIATNTSNIATNTTNITNLQNSVNANTASITSNTASIATNTSNIATNTINIASNTNSITSLENEVNSNTASITSNTTSIASNTSNIATNTSNITSNTNNIATNTSNITTLQTNVAANTASITSLENRVAANTSSITTNTSDIALRATIASPTFTGIPTAPTAAAGTSTTQIATTAFVASVVGGSATPDADATTKGKIQLTNDLGGTAAAPTVNSVGGVSSSTIATLPTSIAANTASITANTNSIATNASNIATNTANIATLQTSVNANTASITANTASIATNTTNIASNTSSITALETRVSSNTAIITTNTNDIAANASDIALRATIASPTFTGIPSAPTAAAGTSTTQIATTAFVASLVGGSATPDADATTKGKIQLANDLGGTASAPTVNSVGGVSSATIATLNTSITAATSINTANTIVKRDANGDFAAGMITANLTGAVTGNASTASKLATARNIFGNTFDGSADITGQLSPAYGGTGVNNGSNTLTLGGSLTTIGADALSLTISGTTNLTLPNSGTLSTIEAAESITGLKTFDNNKISIKGTGAGTTILSSSNTSGTNYTLTLPSLNATIATLSGTESLTNKTIVSPVIINPTGIVSSDVGLGSVNNTSDADKPVSTLQQTALDLKEALANKSTNVTTDAASDIKYPSVKAVKTYVDAQISSSTVNDATTSIKGIIKLGGDLAGTGTSAATPIITDAAITTSKIADDAVTTSKVLDAAITTAKLADGAVTNAKITSMSATKLTGVVSSSNGGAGTLNGILQADGNGNVSVAAAGTAYATPAQVASNYLPLSGGTLTGALNGTTANFSGALTAAGITFPSSDGTAGQLLVTNGSGTLTWSSGALSVGSIAGSSNAKGAVISSNVLSLTPADITNGGIVTTAAQTFSGAKTFSATTTISSLTDATSISDGALIVAGGASIAKNLYVGGLTASKAVFTDANKGLTSTGILGITQGGTGASTKVTAFDALSPMTTAGDIIYGGTSGSGTRLAIGSAGNVLRSNGSAPVWGAVTLTTDVTGVLPIANGGTGSSTQNFVDLTSVQTIAGNKTFSGTTIINAPLSVSGTNLFTAGGTAFPTTSGTVGQVLTISSAGTASWTTSSGTSVTDVVDETTVGAQAGTMSATTASQTNFTISQVPSSKSKVKMFINGIRISNAAYSYYTTSAFTTISASPTIYIKYDPTKNGSYNISANDRVQFDYFY